MDAYLLDTLRIVSSDDVGKDEGTVQLLLRKHDDVSDELQSFDTHIKQLYEKAESLPVDVSPLLRFIFSFDFLPKQCISKGMHTVCAQLSAL